MGGILAQPRSLLVDVAHEKVRDRHARIGRTGFVPDERDGIAGSGLAQRLGGNDPGGAVAEDHVLHRRSPSGAVPSRLRVSALGTPSAFQPRNW